MLICPVEERYRTRIADIFSERNKYLLWMKVEVSLAYAHWKVGNISESEFKAIERASSDVDVGAVKEIEGRIHHDLMALVKHMSQKAGDAGGKVHLGATSYDIEDTATSLMFLQALEVIEESLFSLGDVLSSLVEKTRSLVCIGRTHGQHALPTTYGMKFANYLHEILRHIEHISLLKKRCSVGKMSGAVGTGASFGEKAEEIERIAMEYLGLKPSTISTQVIGRELHSEVIFFLAEVSATCEKMAKEIRNLQRNEILEVSEGFGEHQVGSSTMPHKRNPHRSERVCSLSRVLRAFVQVSLENISLEHERDLTNSANERIVFSHSFIVCDYILSETARILSSLKFYEENIRRNLWITKGGVFAERAMLELVSKGFGRQESHELIRKAAQRAFERGESLRDELKKMGHFSEEELEFVFNPETYLGLAEKKADIVVSKFKYMRARRDSNPRPTD